MYQHCRALSSRSGSAVKLLLIPLSSARVIPMCKTKIMVDKQSCTKSQQPVPGILPAIALSRCSRKSLHSFKKESVLCCSYQWATPGLQQQPQDSLLKRLTIVAGIFRQLRSPTPSSSSLYMSENPPCRMCKTPSKFVLKVSQCYDSRVIPSLRDIKSLLVLRVSLHYLPVKTHLNQPSHAEDPQQLQVSVQGCLCCIEIYTFSVCFAVPSSHFL